MTTGTAWVFDSKGRAVAEFDPDAIRDIPCNWNPWLEDLNVAYASHVMVVAEPLECISSVQLNGVVTARIRIGIGQSPSVGQKYPITFRVTASDGQRDDQTLFLKITDK
jgi:glyoxylate carboligase